jgi:hypothetical protein
MRTLGNLTVIAAAAFNAFILGGWITAIVQDRRNKRTAIDAADMAAANEADDMELWAREMGRV